MTRGQRQLLKRYLPSGAVNCASEPTTDADRAFLVKVIGDDVFAECHCFENASRLVTAASTQRLRYWEGYLVRPDLDLEVKWDFALHHAWAVLDGRVVVELSVRLHDSEIHWDWGKPLEHRAVGALPQGWTYFGVSPALKGQTRKAMLGPRPTTIASPRFIANFISDRGRPSITRSETLKLLSEDLEMDERFIRELYPAQWARLKASEDK